MPPIERVVVDGSNIATEGRQMPSLKHLDDAVQAFMADYPRAEVTVIVDATFGHRIDESERPAFDEAVAHGEIVSPPAGAIGRGDAFLLQVADKVDATVLSNDSFQEFHGDYRWLFDEDRLIGGKPVPGVGWIFTPRNPVRGPKSRESVRGARKTRARVGTKAASRPMPQPSAPPPRGKRQPSTKEVIDEVTKEAVEETESTGGGRRRRRRRAGGPPRDAVNDPLTFIQFIANHKLGAEIEGEVESFASHGAFVVAEDARCYIPLSAMGDPPPRSARAVLQKGEKRTFIVQALDAPRRGVELALPGHEHVSGVPTEETVEAEISRTGPQPGRKKATKKKAAARKKTAPEREEATAEQVAAAEAVAEVAETREPEAARPKKAATRKKAATKKKTAVKKKEAAPKKAAVKKKAATKKTAATKKKTAVKKKAAAKKKAASKKKAAAKKASGSG